MNEPRTGNSLPRTTHDSSSAISRGMPAAAATYGGELDEKGCRKSRRHKPTLYTDVEGECRSMQIPFLHGLDQYRHPGSSTVPPHGSVSFSSPKGRSTCRTLGKEQALSDLTTCICRSRSACPPCSSPRVGRRSGTVSCPTRRPCLLSRPLRRGKRNIPQWSAEKKDVAGPKRNTTERRKETRWSAEKNDVASALGRRETNGSSHLTSNI